MSEPDKTVPNDAYWRNVVAPALEAEAGDEEPPFNGPG